MTVSEINIAEKLSQFIKECADDWGHPTRSILAVPCLTPNSSNTNVSLSFTCRRISSSFSIARMSRSFISRNPTCQRG